MLLSLKFQVNTCSFERVVTLFVGYYFSSGHSVDMAMVVLVRGTKSSRLSRERRGRRDEAQRSKIGWRHGERHRTSVITFMMTMLYIRFI